MTEHTVLVAFTVVADNRNDAMASLQAQLPRPNMESITSWWVAEDDRNDGSDCDSAVFVHPGNQRTAGKVLAAFDLTGKHNVVSESRNSVNQFNGEQV